MKKAELVEMGIPEEKIPGFRKVYWEDVKKQAAIMAKLERERETAPSPEALRAAAGAMLRLIPDPAKLAAIVGYINRQYHQHKTEQAEQQKQEGSPLEDVKGAVSE